MIPEIDIQLKLSYVQLKHIKKLYGQNLGREIASGRKMIKLMKGLYKHDP